MSAARNRLVNALRRSMLQRTALRRQADTARAAFKPRALIDRGKYRLQAKVDDTAQAVRDEFRSNRLPIALAAAAGTLWLLREPIKEHAPRIARRVFTPSPAASNISIPSPCSKRKYASSRYTSWHHSHTFPATS